MISTKLCDTVAIGLINGARDFASFNVGAQDVVGCTHKSACNRLDAIAMDHNEIWLILMNTI
jgi:hypothetical protein